MGHNVSREKQERLDRQITVLHAANEGWRVTIYCPGCIDWRAADLGPIIESGAYVFTWIGVAKRMRCPTCGRRPAMLRFSFGTQHLLTLKV